VVKYAKKLAKIYKADQKTTELAALLHDIGRIDIKNDPIHDSLGAVEAEKILKKLGYSKETIEEVVHAVASHRAKKGAKPKTLIAKIVANADAISHYDMLPIFYYWQGQRNGDIGQWTEWVENKLKRNWDKKLTFPESKKMVAEKYKAIKFLIKEVR
jgi:uncharacterized protein